MSADGKIAPANRVFVPFGSRDDHRLLLELRARADAVMSGARTVDGMEMTMGPGGVRYQNLRKRRGLAEFNLRVIVSGSGSVDPAATIFKHRFSPVIILTTERAGKARMSALRNVGAEIEVCGEREIDFAWALRRLRSGWAVKRLLCEGGGELNGALLSEGLVDEVHVTVCPLILGGRVAPTLADGLGGSSLARAIPLRLTSKRARGGEMFLVYRVLKKRRASSSTSV